MRIIAIMLALVVILGHQWSIPSSRRSDNPEAEKIWQTLPESIRLGLNNQESAGCIRCVWRDDRWIPLKDLAAEAATIGKDERTDLCFYMGATLIPMGSFEPTGGLGSIYDPDLHQE